MGKQCQSWKVNHPDKKDIYNGKNSVLDTFVLHPQMSEDTCPGYEDFSVWERERERKSKAHTHTHTHTDMQRISIK